MMLVVYVMIGLFDPIYTRQALEAFGEMSKALLPALVVVYLLLCVFNLTQGMQKKIADLDRKTQRRDRMGCCASRRCSLAWASLCLVSSSGSVETTGGATGIAGNLPLCTFDQTALAAANDPLFRVVLHRGV